MPRPPRQAFQKQDIDVNCHLANPPSLPEWRQRLFALEEPLRMTISEYDTYFPYVSNVWKHNSRRKRARADDGAVVTYYECRLYHDIKEKDYKYAADDLHVYEKRREGVTARRHDLCDTTMREEKGEEFVVLSRLGKPHRHDLEELDKYKVNDAVRSRTLELVWRGLPPAQILVGLRGVGVNPEALRQLHEAGGKWLTTKTIANWARSYKGLHPDRRRDGALASWEVQLAAATQLLQEKEWLYSEIHCMTTDRESRKRGKEKSHGLVFADEKKLSQLRRHGSTLTTADSTHKMCKLRWYLYTFMARNSAGVWIPCAHLFADSEDSEILSKALVELQYWCMGLPPDGE
jgi:hypothetical protein